MEVGEVAAAVAAAHVVTTALTGHQAEVRLDYDVVEVFNSAVIL